MAEPIPRLQLPQARLSQARLNLDRPSQDEERELLFEDFDNGDIDDLYDAGAPRKGKGLLMVWMLVFCLFLSIFGLTGILAGYSAPEHREAQKLAPVLADVLDEVSLEASGLDINLKTSATTDEYTSSTIELLTTSSVPTPATAPTPVSESLITSRSEGDYILDADWEFEAEPQRREYEWTITDAEFNPDGVYRPMIVINHKFPGELIECNEGDTLIVHVHNEAVNATSIHWHGMYQNSTNHMDGTVGITQCPIGPGESFTYEFQVSGQSGTYFYHGHVGLQASDGLFGPLVIHSKDEKELQKLDYATDRVVMIQDHYHDLSGALLPQYLEPGRENDEPVPDGALMNGRNIRDCSFPPLENRVCDNSTASKPIFNLAQGRNHRLRFINVGAMAEFQIQLDEHEFGVTEVDGIDVEPAFYHRLNIAPAQRYSIIVTTDATTADSFWLRARMVTHCFRIQNPAMEAEVWGIINYKYPSDDGDTDESLQDRQQTLPTSKDWSESIEVICKDMNTDELIPVNVTPAPRTADALIYLRGSFQNGWWRYNRGFFNTSSWHADMHSPTLSRAIDGLSTNNEKFAIESNVGVNSVAFNLKHELVVQTNGIQTIDVAIQNFDDGAHPLHLHGYKYFVLAHGNGHFPIHNLSSVYDTLDFSNPLRRDTATLESYAWLLIRFVADNAGAWAFHCHNAWHTEAGLLMQFLARTEVIGQWTVPEDNLRLCNAEGLEKGQAPQNDLWFNMWGPAPPSKG